ncbi:hypothetical protein E3N88_05789 [Mikania micrantha]|uniref:Pentacotripeptide-repeat region of PRORP domain-containing protein n=1 Tax=Mikania micrantha TaxID=192012 RepID=A0A5N6PLY4_9ASTR|nr:hypothetical protein E3N88_05789 [Mikania micrantha]
MADKLALPLLLPSPPLSKPFFSQDTHHQKPHHNQPPPITPILNDILQPNSATTKPISPIIPRPTRRIGKHNDPNKGKPWSSHLSPKGQQIFQTLIDPNFSHPQINDNLVTLVDFHEIESEFDSKSLSLDVLGLIQGLAHHNKVDLALKPTKITYNVILNVYGKMGMPWNKIESVFDSMKNSGVFPDSYTFNTLISCCKRGSLHEEAYRIFEEMKLAGCMPDYVTFNTLLDVYAKSRKPNEAMNVLREMESKGFSPSVVTYNSLISCYAKDGLFDEAMELKGKMLEKGIKPDVFTYTTLFSGFEKAGKMSLP